ncbi:MAG: cell wall hydrolase, partial [Pseudomonadota bacterium]
MKPAFALRSLLALVAATTLSACKTGPTIDDGGSSFRTASYSKPHFGSLGARNCLMRAMYFESIRSSREGLLAVGTVVMNRVESPKFPNTVCGVVGQRRQFAPGVLTRKMRGDQKELADLADDILAGKRHPGV